MSSPSTISLAVTQKVLDHASRGKAGEKQMAIRNMSPELRTRLSLANAKNHVSIELGNAVQLTVGDTGAIWRAHNGASAEDFDLLFQLLARRPDVSMEFLCRVI